MQVPYHGKSLVDTGFPYINIYCSYGVDLLYHSASVVRKSAASNKVVVFGGGDRMDGLENIYIQLLHSFQGY